MWTTANSTAVYARDPSRAKILRNVQDTRQTEDAMLRFQSSYGKNTEFVLRCMMYMRSHHPGSPIPIVRKVQLSRAESRWYKYKIRKCRKRVADFYSHS
eukprot:1722328-Pleurochrysis_carterae.AAC.1